MPLASLRERMMCPRCGNRRVNLIFDPPPAAARAGVMGGAARFFGSRAQVKIRTKPGLSAADRNFKIMPAPAQ
jgi:hypothetical protein